MKNPTFKMFQAMAGVTMCATLLDLQLQRATRSGLEVEFVDAHKGLSHVEFRSEKTGRPVFFSRHMKEDDRLLLARAAAEALMVRIDRKLRKKTPTNSFRKGHRL